MIEPLSTPVVLTEAEFDTLYQKKVCSGHSPDGKILYEVRLGLKEETS